MRIKFLAVIVGLIITSITITSCLGSDNAIDYSSDATIHAFGIDTIHGKYYKFSIDQLNRQIYNLDSLPVGSDTIINRILIDTLTVTGWVTSGPTDTLFSISDSVDLRKPIEIKVHAADGLMMRQYRIQVNVHKQDPDSLVWDEMNVNRPAFSSSPIKAQKSVILVNGASEELFVYTSNTTAYKTSTDATKYMWSQVTVNNLPSNAKLNSVVNFNGTLYMATGEEKGKVYSSIDGITWNEVNSLGDQVVTLICELPETFNLTKRLVGIRVIGDTKYFCTTTDESTLAWKELTETEKTNAIVPNDFPLKDLYTTVYTTINGTAKAVLVGNTTGTGTQTIPWFTIDGASWANMSTTSDAYCPGMVNPSIMYYGSDFYIFGGDFSAIYKSLSGVAWYKTEKKFLLPESFKDKGAYSMTIDKNNYIWIVFNGNGSGNAPEIWRGRLNRLGFKRQ